MCFIYPYSTTHGVYCPDRAGDNVWYTVGMQVDLWGAKIKITEAMVLKDIQQYLSLKGIFHWRNNSGSFKPETGGYVRFGFKGSSDLLGVYPGGRMFCIEAKKPGGALSDFQIEFLKSVRSKGGVILVAESVQDVIECLKNPDYIGGERYKKLLQ